MESKQNGRDNAFKNGFQKGQEMIFLTLLLKYSASQIADMLDLPTDYIFETIGLVSEREVGDRCFQKGLASAKREGYADTQAFAYANAVAEAIAEEYPQGYAEGRIKIMGNLAKKTASYNVSCRSRRHTGYLHRGSPMVHKTGNRRKLIAKRKPHIFLRGILFLPKSWSKLKKYFLKISQNRAKLLAALCHYWYNTAIKQTTKSLDRRI